MTTKPTLTILTALLLAPLAALHAAELRVVNGDFSDLTGLTSGDAHGCHGGVPAAATGEIRETDVQR